MKMFKIQLGTLIFQSLNLAAFKISIAVDLTKWLVHVDFT